MAKSKRFQKTKSLRAWKKVRPEYIASVEEIRQYLTDIFKQRETSQPWSGTNHYVWEENGKQYSMWEVNGTGMGDGAYRLYLEALQKQASQLL